MSKPDIQPRLFEILFLSSTTTTKQHQQRDPHLTPLLHVNCYFCYDGDCGGVPAESQMPHPPLLLISCVHCCRRASLRPAKCTSSCAIFVVFAPCWKAASSAAFILHQMQITSSPHSSSSNRCCTLPLCCLHCCLPTPCLWLVVVWWADGVGHR